MLIAPLVVAAAAAAAAAARKPYQHLRGIPRTDRAGDNVGV